MNVRILPLLLLCLIPLYNSAQTIGGIGAQLKLDSAEHYTLPVIQGLVPGSPAAKSLKVNTYILKVDDHACKDEPLERIVNWIRGTAGSQVKLLLADNIQGKQSTEQTLTRAAIATQDNNGDPVTPFYASCEAEVKQMKRSGTTVVKTFNSECGDYFFNFDAAAKGYAVQLWILQSPNNGNAGTPEVTVTDNGNERNSVRMQTANAKVPGRLTMTGHIAFTRETVGTIAVKLNDAAAGCQAMYVVVYEQ